MKVKQVRLKKQQERKQKKNTTTATDNEQVSQTMSLNVCVWSTIPFTVVVKKCTLKNVLPDAVQDEPWEIEAAQPWNILSHPQNWNISFLVKVTENRLYKTIILTTQSSVKQGFFNTQRWISFVFSIQTSGP